jgi:Family of unknown function (DUF5715)
MPMWQEVENLDGVVPLNGRDRHRKNAAPPVLTNSALRGYRAAVEDLVEEVRGRLLSSGLPVIEGLVDTCLGQSEVAAVLAHLDGGVDAVAGRLTHEIRTYQPGARSSACDLPTFIRILLISQIDSVWWSATIPFTSDADVLRSTELVDLPRLRSSKVLQFRYRAQPAGWPGRARDWAHRKAFPAIGPHVAGLRFTRSRPVVVAIVNQIAREFAAALPRAPRLWVTSMVRSVEHQHRLRSLGYAAVLPSSHCTGYACDLEMDWFRRFDPENLLARLLREHQEAGRLNAIDEGHALHLCVSPLACDELQAAFHGQLRVR